MIAPTGTIPRQHRTSIIDRPRLTSIANDILQRRVTLVCAPAGYGKTTLLAQWRATLLARGTPTAWLSVDRTLNTGRHFVAAVCKSLAMVDAETARFVEGKLSAIPPLDTRALAAIVGSIGDAEQHIVVILDDVQEIDNDEVDGWLRHLVTTTPGVHWVIATRQAPLWALGRLRAMGETNLVDAASLSFSEEEIRAYLDAVGSRPSRDRFAEELSARTQGWPMAVQLAALNPAHADDLPQLHQKELIDRDLLFAYFEDAVLAALPEPVTQLLFATAWLQPFSADLAGAVTMIDDCGAIIEELLAKNLFITPVERTGNWYRYHPLFLEFLKSRSARTGGDFLQTLHSRASAWFECQGLLVDAVASAFRCGELDRAQRLVERSLDRAFTSGQFGIAGEWLSHLTEDFVCARPVVLRYVIWTLIVTHRLEEADQWLRLAHRLLEAPETETPLTAEARIELRYNVEAAELLIERSRSASRPDPGPYLNLLAELPSSCRLLRAILQLDLAGVYVERGELDKGHAAYLLAENSCAAIGFHFGRLNALLHRGTILRLQGRLTEAIALCHEALTLCSDEQRRTDPMAGWAYLALAELYYERNKLDLARRAASKAEDLVHQVNHTDWTVRLLETQALLSGHSRLERPDFRTAEQAALRRQTRRNLLRLRGWLGEAAAFDRDPVLASQYFAAVGLEADSSPPSGTATTIELRNQLHFASFLILTRREALAAKWLRPICNTAQAMGLRPMAALAALLLASIYRKDPADAAEADRLLKVGLGLAHQSELVRSVIDRAELVRPLLEAALDRLPANSKHRAYAGYLIDVMNDVEAAPPARADAPVQLYNADDVHLTEREANILGLIASGLRNKQIAERLGIADATLRWHITNLYEKLQITTRTQAVREAQRRGLSD